MSWGVGVYQHYRAVWNGVNGEIKKRRPEIDAVEKLQKQKEALSKEIAEFDKIEAGETSKVEVLRELAHILPGTVWIWNFKYNGKEFEISGFADSASDLIPLLDKSPLFEKVEFLAPVTKERFQTVVAGAVTTKEKERFKIKMKIEAKR
jgi:general secretion pathway protein L